MTTQIEGVSTAPSANRRYDDGPVPGSSLEVGELAHAGLRGVIAAMAMTGMRTFTKRAGIIEEAPPEAIFRQRAKKLLMVVPKKRRRGVVELAHWAYGGGGGVVFGMLPDGVRRRPWAGPIYGLALWAGFEAMLAPGLGLKQARKVRPLDRLGLAADHALYGFVLSETRRQPRR